MISGAGSQMGRRGLANVARQVINLSSVRSGTEVSVRSLILHKRKHFRIAQAVLCRLRLYRPFLHSKSSELEILMKIAL